MKRSFRDLIEDNKKHLYLNVEGDRNYSDSLFMTYLENEKAFNLDADGFMGLLYLLCGLRKCSRNKERIVLSRSVAEQSLQNIPSGVFTMPIMPNGAMYIETDFNTHTKDGKHIDGILLLDKKTFEFPSLLTEVNNDAFIAVVIANGSPVCSLEMPCHYQFADLAKAYGEQPENSDELTVMIASMIALENIKLGAYKRQTKLESKPNVKPTQFKLKRRKIKRSKKPVNNRVITYTHESVEPQTPVKTESSEVRENKSFTYTPRNVRSHYKARWVSLEYANLVDPDDILDIKPITKQLKSGEVTKDMALVKIWFEFKHNPALEPNTTVKRYK